MRGGPPETAAHLANDGRLSQYILLWLFSFLFHENEIKNYFFFSQCLDFLLLSLSHRYTLVKFVLVDIPDSTENGIGGISYCN